MSLRRQNRPFLRLLFLAAGYAHSRTPLRLPVQTKANEISICEADYCGLFLSGLDCCRWVFLQINAQDCNSMGCRIDGRCTCLLGLAQRATRMRTYGHDKPCRLPKRCHIPLCPLRLSTPSTRKALPLRDCPKTLLRVLWSLPQPCGRAPEEILDAALLSIRA